MSKYDKYYMYLDSFELTMNQVGESWFDLGSKYGCSLLCEWVNNARKRLHLHYHGLYLRIPRCNCVFDEASMGSNITVYVPSY